MLNLNEGQNFKRIQIPDGLFYLPKNLHTNPIFILFFIYLFVYLFTYLLSTRNRRKKRNRLSANFMGKQDIEVSLIGSVISL